MAPPRDGDTHDGEPPFRGRSAAWLWLGWGIGPAAWALHQNVSYALVPALCEAGDGAWLHLVTAVALALAAAALLLSWRNWRRAGRGWPGPEGGPAARSRFMAFAGMMIAALSLAGIAVEGIPNFILDPCVR
ncbi:hypothetical protein [Arenibaculum sp.]|jgi:hypothetical protein|uniref:hypothetical protein n=1 Tax=Arenibaculum sp. TaxID=2865862 RepID=UPI002E1573BC|nr:hypothetical protein [Arenibaculum sp.]